MAHANADRRDLAVLDPDAGQTDSRGRRDPGFGQGFHEQLLQPAQVSMQILAAPPQVEDRVTDQLSRSMIGGLAAAVDREERMREMARPAKTRLIGGAADRVNR